MITKISFPKLKEFLKVFVLGAFIVTTSGYPLSTVSGNYFHLALIIPIAAFLIKDLLFLNFNKPLIANSQLALYVILLLSILFSFISNGNYSFLNTNIKLVLIITFAYLFTKNVRFDNFIEYYVRVLKVIVFISLIGYVLINFEIILTSLPVIENVNGVRYYNGIVFFSLKDFGFNTPSGTGRNIGVFWEPGLYASFLIIGLLFEIGFKKKFSYYTIGFFLIALLTTLSTFAYLMLLLLLAFKVGNRITKAQMFFVYGISAVVVIFLFLNYEALLNYLYVLKPELFGKVVESSISLTDRIESPLTNIKIFFDNPIFGAGLGKAETIFSNLTEAAQTSTSTFMVAAFGIFGISYTVFFVYGIMSLKMLNSYMRIIVIILILLIVNKEPHIFFTITYIILFYFLNVSREKYYGVLYK